MIKERWLQHGGVESCPRIWVMYFWSAPVKPNGRRLSCVLPDTAVRRPSCARPNGSAVLRRALALVGLPV
eukprot:12937381-Prorocentrum_lima.AAC.1